MQFLLGLITGGLISLFVWNNFLVIAEPSKPTADANLIWSKTPTPNSVANLVKTTPVATATAESTPIPRNSHLGLVEMASLDPKVSGELGASYQRITFPWPQLQMVPSFPLRAHEPPLWLIDRELKAGSQIIGLIMGTPEWAAAHPQYGSYSIPKNLYLAIDHPDNHWARFTYQLALDYKERIRDWIVGNEPDITPWDANSTYHTFAGPVEDYYQYLKVAYRSTKKGNPNARVHLAGLTYWTDAQDKRKQYFERLLDLVKADTEAASHNHYFDVVTLHLYSDPEAIYQVIKWFNDTMTRYGIQKPIWLNETNIIPFDDPVNRGTDQGHSGELRCTLEDQANFLLQTFSLGLAAGAEKVSFYKAMDSPGVANNPSVDAMERSALIREDGSVRPVFRSFQVISQHLKEMKKVQQYQVDGIGLVRMERADGIAVSVLWSKRSAPIKVRIPARAPQAELVDSQGKVEQVSADAKGDYLVSLPPATCGKNNQKGQVLVGGPTFLLLEQPKK
jgi:hypothetical protein